ncbi:MAG: hypothetical protein QOG13_284 [Sphingomonadales bacterium]|nr:hypothetical protein [Sphingomonadales bacterium]MEA3045052.1 hypothetical protein [Sphingomonadales bacterium]
MRLSLGAVTIALADAPRPRPRRSGEDPYGPDRPRYRSSRRQGRLRESVTRPSMPVSARPPAPAFW